MPQDLFVKTPENNLLLVCCSHWKQQDLRLQLRRCKITLLGNIARYFWTWLYCSYQLECQLQFKLCKVAKPDPLVSIQTVQIMYFYFKTCAYKYFYVFSRKNLQSAPSSQCIVIYPLSLTFYFWHLTFYRLFRNLDCLVRLIMGHGTGKVCDVDIHVLYFSFTTFSHLFRPLGKLCEVDIHVLYFSYKKLSSFFLEWGGTQMSKLIFPAGNIDKLGNNDE